MTSGAHNQDWMYTLNRIAVSNNKAHYQLLTDKAKLFSKVMVPAYTFTGILEFSVL